MGETDAETHLRLSAIQISAGASSWLLLLILPTPPPPPHCSCPLSPDHAVHTPLAVPLMTNTPTFSNLALTLQL